MSHLRILRSKLALSGPCLLMLLSFNISHLKPITTKPVTVKGNSGDFRPGNGHTRHLMISDSVTAMVCCGIMTTYMPLQQRIGEKNILHILFWSPQCINKTTALKHSTQGQHLIPLSPPALAPCYLLHHMLLNSLSFYPSSSDINQTVTNTPDLVFIL